MSRPLLIAPAMNTHMWNHPLTARQLKFSEELGYRIIPPIAKKLACGDIGMWSIFFFTPFVLHDEEKIVPFLSLLS